MVILIDILSRPWCLLAKEGSHEQRSGDCIRDRRIEKSAR